MIFETPPRDPDGIALDDLTRTRTRAELGERAVRAARLLRDELGLGPDDRAALLMGNRVEMVELTLGAILAGVWLTPINRHLTREEIAYIVADSGARVLFTDAERTTLVNEALAAGRRDGSSATTGHDELPAARATVIEAGDELEAALASVSNAPLSPDGPPGATMIYTSGTTGRPKGVKRARAATVRDALEAGRRAGATIGLDGSGPHLVTGPLYHAAPLLFAIYDLLGGAPVVIMPRWDESEALRLIEERAVRHTHLVPTMFVRLLRLPEETRASTDVSSLDVVLHGAAPISVAVKRRMIDWWGPVLVEYWGATEGGVCTLVDSREWLAHPGTVGACTPAFEVFAVDDEGRRLPAGETGTLYCRHKQLETVFEYHGDPAKTAAAYLEPGSFTTGDVGKVDVDGYVYLADRKSNMIISGGVNIYPLEIEQVIQEHPAVADVAVFGVPDDDWGESVKAAVELVPGTEPSRDLALEILAWTRGRLAGYKVPRSVDFEAALPRHPTGKLLVRELRDRYWQGRERKI
jgi:long-chain acyl-CoA synthetase